MASYESLQRLKGMTARIPMLAADFIIHDIGYCRPQNIEIPHSHLFHELYFILTGKVTVCVDEKEVQMEEGELLYISAKTRHFCLFHPGQDYSYLTLSFNFSNISSNINEDYYQEFIKDEKALIDNLIHNRYLKTKDTCGCAPEIDRMCERIELEYMGECAKIRCYLLNFFISALQSFSKIKRRSDFDEIADIGIINKAVRIASHMWNHLPESISLQSVSADLCYSPRHIQRIINEYFNISFTDLLIQYRIGYAKLLLCSTHHSLELISEKVGFCSSKTLCLHFKASERMTPTEYRKLHAKATSA